MTTDNTYQNMLDAILALQMTVAWAGEGLCAPKRLDWWRTDLVDELGGGDLFQRLFPKTHQWASLEAVRKVAIQQDRQARLDMAKPDQVRTLFFWGFAIDERLAERLTFHKRNGKPPMEVLSFPVEVYGTFSKADFEEAICIPGQKIDFKVVPSGREIADEMPESLNLCAQKLTAGLLPLTNSYPMPFYRIKGA